MYNPPDQELPKATSDEGRAIRKQIDNDFPFLEYATNHVLYHADAAQGCSIPQTDFLDQFPVTDWVSKYNQFERHKIRRYSPKPSLLYIFANHDLPMLIRLELERVPSMDILGERYEYPFFAAIANSNKAAFKALITPLTCTCLQSHANLEKCACSLEKETFEHIWKMVLAEKEVAGMKGYPPFCWALSVGDARLGEILLLNPKMNIRLCTKSGVPAVRIAVASGYYTIVEHLLAHGFDPESRDGEQTTLLSLAARMGHAKIVKLLLSRSEVDVNLKDSTGYTPLMLAAREGYIDVVQLLLSHSEVDINSRNLAGDTSLMYAAREGHEKMVKLLLAHPDIQADAKNNKGLTPLLTAAKFNHEAVFEILLTRPEVDVTISDTVREELPSLFAAINSGNTAMVRLYLKQPNLNINSCYTIYNTPLMSAISQGQKTIVKLLLGYPEIDVNKRSSDSQETALFSAAESKMETITQMLLNHPNIDVNKGDGSGRTPLLRAAQRGFEEIVKLLLAHPSIDVNLKDNSGRTALSEAQRSREKAVIDLLLANSQIKLD